MRRIERENKGVVQSLPLLLIVIVIIAAIGIAILVGWMYMVKKPELGYISIEYKDMLIGNTYDFNITAYDTTGKPLKDVKIHLEGCGCDVTTITGDDGKAYFSITPELPLNVHTGEIHVTAQYTGTTTKTLTDIITVHD